MTNYEKNNQQGGIGSASQNVPEQDQGKKTERENLDQSKDTRRDTI